MYQCINVSMYQCIIGSAPEDEASDGAHEDGEQLPGLSTHASRGWGEMEEWEGWRRKGVRACGADDPRRRVSVEG